MIRFLALLSKLLFPALIMAAIALVLLLHNYWYTAHYTPPVVAAPSKERMQWWPSSMQLKD